MLTYHKWLGEEGCIEVSRLNSNSNLVRISMYIFELYAPFGGGEKGVGCGWYRISLGQVFIYS